MTHVQAFLANIIMRAAKDANIADTMIFCGAVNTGGFRRWVASSPRNME